MSDVVVSVTESVTDVSVADDVVAVSVTESPVQVQVSESNRQSEDFAFTIVGGSTGTQPTFSGTPLFSGSYVRTGALVHFQIHSVTVNTSLDRMSPFALNSCVRQ
jgi:hypothetical protein